MTDETLGALSARVGVLCSQVGLMGERIELDSQETIRQGKLLVEIHTLLHSHIQRYEEHVQSDRQREETLSAERRLIAERVLTMEKAQQQTLWSLGIILLLAQLALKFWK